MCFGMDSFELILLKFTRCCKGNLYILSNLEKFTHHLLRSLCKPLPFFPRSILIMQMSGLLLYSKVLEALSMFSDYFLKNKVYTFWRSAVLMPSSSLICFCLFHSDAEPQNSAFMLIFAFFSSKFSKWLIIISIIFLRTKKTHFLFLSSLPFFHPL